MDFAGSFDVDHARFLELEPQVVALARALAHAGEDRVAAVLERDVVDQLHDQHGLAHAGAAEQPGLAALEVGLEQVDDLDPGLEHLDLGVLLSKLGASRWIGQCSFASTGPSSSTGSPMTLSTRPSVASPTGILIGEPVSSACMPRTRPSVGTMATQRTPVLTEVLLDLGDDIERHAGFGARVLDTHRVVDGRQVLFVELDVHHRTDDLNHASDLAHRSSSPFLSRVPRRPKRPR